jgi:hypothetical protein
LTESIMPLACQGGVMLICSDIVPQRLLDNTILVRLMTDWIPYN